MQTFPKSEIPRAAFPARILGIGNAGTHLADQLSMSAGADCEVLAMNTDAQSLFASVTSRKSTLGAKATRGLGAGGDPEVGYEAAQESIEEIRFAVEGASTVILLAGLGGGTGSGAIPTAAAAAREAGAFVLAIVTMPFSFEGRRRDRQATEALEALTGQAHAVIRFDNDRMADLTSPLGGIGETFQASDALLTDCVTSFLEMLSGRGPIPMNLGNLLTVLRDGSSCALFGRGASQSDNRAHEAIERALKSPLLDRGRMLDDAEAVVAHVSGPPSLSYAETSAIMQELGRHVPEDARLFLSVSLEDSPASLVTVTIFGSYAEQPASRSVERPMPARTTQPVARTSAAPVPPIAHKPNLDPKQADTPSETDLPARPEADPPHEAPHDPSPDVRTQPASDDFLHPSPPGRLFGEDGTIQPPPAEPPAATPTPVPPPPQKRTSRVQPSAAPAKKPATPKAHQETLQFEPAARGRFDKSEPTIVEGEDLDVPTYMRRGHKL